MMQALNMPSISRRTSTEEDSHTSSTSSRLFFPVSNFALSKGNQKLSFFHAVQSGNLSLTELLLNKDIAVNSTDDHSMTALHWAVQNRNNLLISFLIQHGADPNAVCSENLLTHVSARNNSVKNLHYLLSHGGNENYCDARNVDILCYSVSNSAALSTEYLVCFSPN